MRENALESCSFKKYTFVFLEFPLFGKPRSGGQRGGGSHFRELCGGLRGGRRQPERPTPGIESLKSNRFFQSRLRSVCLRRFKLALEVAQMLPLFKETVIKDRVDISLRSVTYFLLISCQKKSRGSS